MWFDSMRVSEIDGAQSLIGMPGKPAPEPTSPSATGGPSSSRALPGWTADGGRASREEAAGHEEAFAEMAGYDLFGVADGGEVDAGIPTH